MVSSFSIHIEKVLVNYLPSVTAVTARDLSASLQDARLVLLIEVFKEWVSGSTSYLASHITLALARSASMPMVTGAPDQTHASAEASKNPAVATAPQKLVNAFLYRS
jgi:hypothetical protein